MGDKMSDKKEEKNVIATTRQFERIKIIHEHIKNMEYPNVPRLVEIINARANTKEEETSIPTINRDIGLMKEQYKAPDMLCHLSMANSKFNKKRKGFRNQDFRH